MAAETIHGFRLSPQQERLWRLASGGESLAFLSRCDLRIEGPLDPDRLRRSLRWAVARHEILRTVFRSLPGMELPVQVILDSDEIAFESIDLSRARAPEERRREIDAWAARTGADLAAGPLLRAVHASLGGSEHHVVLVLPALCADAVSLQNLVREVGEGYAGPEPRDEPLQYADVVEVLHEILESDETAAGREYWRSRRPEGPLDLGLPSLRPGSGVRAQERVAVDLPPDLAAAVAGLSAARGLSMSSFLRTAWTALLGRLAGRGDVTLGTAYACRSYEDLDGALGLYARYLPLRCAVAPARTLTEAWREQEEGAREAEAWQDSFSWELMEEPSTTPGPRFFPFAFEYREATAVECGGLHVAAQRLESRFDHASVVLAASRGQSGLELAVRHDPTRLAPVAARRLLDRLQTLIASAVETPDRPIGALELVGRSERHRVLVELNDSAVPRPDEGGLHRRVEARGAEVPDRVALTFGERSLTFAHLDERSSRLADRLLLLGVEPDTLVAVCLERGDELVVALLAVLKAGAAYLPLDPAYPPARLDLLVRDSRPRALVTRRALLEGLPSLDVPVLALDTEQDDAWPSVSARRLALSGDHLAYVIYTSGSTGRPKGVMVSHRAISNRLLWMQRELPLDAGDAVLFKTPFSFDASIWELFVPLIAGARVVVARPGGEGDSGYLARSVARHRVTVLQLVPSLLQVLVEEPGLGDCVGLRRLFSGGEALPGELARRLLSRLDVELHNLYGPTETAIDASHRRVREEDGASPLVPIGRPLDNLRAFVVDAGLEPSPAGVAGELLVAGESLARGYLGRPRLTAERFVPDRFAPCPGGRAYRTGDRVRHGEDGSLEFAGRLDHQVKVRGFRIEPGEVEAALLRQAGVAQAVVSVRRDDPGDPRLVAYLIAERGRDLDPEALQHALEASLPAHMVPSAVVVLPRLPLLPNGKVDRDALPAPAEAARPPSEGPRTMTEELLVGLWAELLGVERVGIRDDFFELGGHSLSATQLAARLRRTLGVELPLRSFFDHPTVADLGVVVDEARRARAGFVRPPLEPVSRDRPLPLSFSQQRLWVLDRLEPGNPAYNLSLVHRLEGALDRPALHRALSEVCRRHESLRTVLRQAGGEPVQLVLPPRTPPFPRVDLDALPAARRAPEGLRLARLHARRPFDLARGPLLRAVLVRLGAHDHLSLLSMHHAVGDGSSTVILTRELAALYRAFTGGAPSPLPALAIQYPDFSVWQRSWLRGEELAAQLAFWRGELVGLPVLQLPTDRPRPAHQTFEGAVQPVRLPRPEAERLAALGRDRGASLFMTLLAAFAALLARYGAPPELAIGFPIANRSRTELEGLIGFFANTLVLRADLREGPGFAGLLDRVRDRALKASAHQDLPFERLVELLEPDRDLSQNPLFQVMLVVQHVAREPLRIEGLTVTTSPIDAGTAKLDLTLDLVESPQGIVGALEYNTDLFDATTVKRMAGHFSALLREALADPGRPLGELALLTPAERRQLASWNDTAVRFSGADAPLHELVAGTAARVPEAVAVDVEGAELTYGELDQRAELLARHLAALGVRPEATVALCVERSLEMVIALLGVLKAGGAFLPLNPDDPPARLARLLDDAAPSAVLTVARLAHRLPEGRAPVVRLDADWQRIASVRPEASPAPVSADRLAYVLYTSGSTGEPKGVMVSHRGIVNRLLWGQEALPLEPGDRVLQKTPYTFDVSLWELFWPLLVGARLVMARPGGHRDARYLARRIAEGGVTTLHFVPSMLQAFLEEPGAASCRSIRRVISSGEALGPELRDRFFARVGAPLFNLYGPTEASIEVSSSACDPTHGRRVPIGRPISNLRLHVVDPHGRPVPIGVPGELLIGGVGVARGYRGRPGLTGASFVPDALGGGPGERVYRTGDFARWSASGDLEFLGRIDHQVKVRGFRIELGEIEAALERRPEIRQAVVTARSGWGGARLVAHAVPRPGPAPDARELLAALARELPEYMVPWRLVFLDHLPLTASGKVAREALPEPEPAGAPAARRSTGPRTPTQEIVASLWEEVLAVPAPAGLDDDFFRLGGHSLLATRLVSALHQAFGVEVPLRALFEAPTVRGVAGAVDRLVGWGGAAGAPPLDRAPRGESLPLSFAQERLWFLDRLLPERPLYNIAPGALRLRGRFDLPAFARAVAEVVRRHETLRTRFTAVAGEPRVEIETAASRRLPVVDLSALPAGLRARRARALAASEARRPFDLRRGPVFRGLVARLAPGDHVVAFCVHHIVSDAVSQDLFAAELGALYAAFRAGEPSPLEELRVQYADYAGWQRRWLQGGPMRSQLDYWQERLTGLPALALPTDRPRAAVPSFRGARELRVLGEEPSRRLRALAGERRATLFMTLCAGLAALLQRYTGESDVGIGFPIAHRGRRELEPLIGLFINTLVLRIEATPTLGLAALVARVRETALDAYAQQDAPFELVVSRLQPERDTSRNPLVQLVFHQLPGVPEAPELPGLEVERVDQGDGPVRFDLEVAAVETGGRVALHLGYAADLFDRSTARRLLGHLEALLASGVRNPERAVGDLPYLDAAERSQLLVGWNDPYGEYPSAATLSGAFFERMERAPEAAAVSCEGGHLSYGELGRRANRLAHHLRDLGVGPDVPVGVCLERGSDLVVALLAVLAAGGAYLPLDPAYPRARLQAVLEDSGAAVVVTGGGLADALARHGGTTVRLEDEALWARRPATPPGVACSPDHLAYVIYTSGSTGTPKGVAISHRHVLRLLAATDRWFGCGPDDVWTLFHSYAFDFSVWELWGALVSGGRVVVVPYWISRSPADFRRLLVREAVTVLNQTPSAFRQLAVADDAEAGADPELALRLVIFGGEALDPGGVRAWAARHGLSRPRLVNMYGITETTVHVTYRPLTEGDLAAAAASPLGRPIPDLQLHLLDAGLRLVPVGVAGEIAVGGAGVARGYLGRPALTAERMVPDPFAVRPGARLYRSGDLARRRSDGDLEYQGRLDHQVKVRGVRIELGEVEAVLTQHPAVREAVVVLRGDRPEERTVVAYAVVAPESGVAAAALREYLAERLPEAMVPSAVVPLDALPLTPQGKVDRRALPEPGLELPRAAPTSAARTATEEAVAAVWSGLLGVETVGREEGFFDLGGHSLLATRALARVGEVFGVEVPLRALFDRPTVAGTAEEVERALAEGRPAPPPIPRAPRDEALPLSFAQRRLWFLDELAPGSALYNIPLALGLRGALDLPSLRRALGAVTLRHEALRTVVRRAAGHPLQVVLPPALPPLPVVDLTALPPELREPVARRLAGREARRPFDLATGPVLRVGAVRLAAAEHLLLVTLHHIAGDRWSLDVLLSELSALYRAFRAGTPAALRALPVQYADYALWQRRWLDGEPLEHLLRYWRERLGEDLPALELPTDRPRPPLRSERGGTCYFEVPEGLGADLERLARREGVTLFTVLLAAFQALLARLSGQLRFAVGTPVAGRTRPEVEGLIGFFVNNLVLPAELHDDPRFVDHVGRTGAGVLGALAHQDLPFEKLVEELRPRRSLDRSPLFQAMLILQNTPGAAAQLPGLEAVPLETESGTSKYDVTVALAARGQGLSGALEYSRDLFDSTTARTLIARFTALLAGAVRNPACPVSELPFLSPVERHQALVGWNDTGTSVGAAPAVHRMFAEQVVRTPEAIAVRHGDRALSYRALEAVASRLAGRLRALGAGPERRVGLCLERRPETVAALLATLEVGAAYVPMDPALPAQRLAFLADDADLALVVVDAASDGLPSTTGAEILRLDVDPTLPAQAQEAPSPVHPESPAYVLYTSGSTGRPKGVEVTQAALAGLLASMAPRLGLGPGDRLPAITSLSFDIASAELLLPLTVGAEVVLFDHSAVVDGARLAVELDRAAVSLMQATPATWRTLLSAGWAGRPGLRLVSTGEALPRDLADDLAHRGARLWNLYGPTETTIWSAAAVVEKGPGPVPIGGPIDGTALYVVDRHGVLVPSGVFGELWIGGSGVARGYLHRPALTAERFVPDPFAAAAGARLYRSGDLVRRRAGGSLEFAGRLDHQVKVRGVRIELEEIEAALRSHPEVAEAAVAARPERAGGTGLVGYVVARPGAAPATDALRAFLGERLPGAMVPGRFVRLDRLPMTATRKVDRGALPDPEADRPELAVAFTPPATATERAVAAVWREVLGIERVGAQDSFFDLGGHSLLLGEVQARLADEQGAVVPIVEMFRHPTVAALAAFLDDREPSVSAAEEGSARARTRRSADRLQQRRREVRR